jgi:translation initiation factor IF-3
LVEVSGGANPPVCRIMDYNKYLYEQKAKSKQTKTKKTEMKEFQLGPTTGEGDLKLRIERGRKFLLDGNVVKYTVKFRGRAKLFPELGETKLKIIESELADVSRVEKPAKLLGNIMTMTLAPSGK